ncbi:Alpha-2-macroglobulin family N-terminal region [Candidatus Fervidibacteria bacterium JGI MDM2 JNZ-1-D12]
MRVWVWLTPLAWIAGILATAFGLQQSHSQTQSPYLPPPLDTQVFGQMRWLADSPVVLKIVTLDRQKQKPVKSQVRIVVGSKTVFAGTTNDDGIVDAQFRAPSQAGTYDLKITVKSPVGSDQIDQTVTVEESAQILLTTDKPIYQPSQTIHIRALCLRKPDLKPAADLPCTFEVCDPKGNLVFRTTERTSRFGIAATQFPIADEVTLGEYRITATLQNPAPRTSHSAPLAVVEKTVRVERYVLPKFKVTIETEKRFYLPAETLRGTISAAYFFGKPVSDGEVTVRLSTFAAGWHDIAELKGTLDEKGFWQFETRLPEKFVGLPLEGGNALLRVEATVTDKAEHSERTSITLPISSEPIKIAVVPESIMLKPELPMRIFVVTTYPDGTPAKCKFEITGRGTGDEGREFTAKGETDAFGIGEVTVKLKAVELPKFGKRAVGFAPAPFIRRRPIGVAPEFAPLDEPSLPIMVTVTASDEKGNRSQVQRPLALSASEEAVLLRVDKSIAKVGDNLRLDIFVSSRVPRPASPVFIDAIVNRQTMLTKTVDLQNGRGTVNLTLTPELTGTLVLHAYRITSEGDIVRDTKVVFVEPANELQIKVTSDKSTYRPGETAQVRFAVTDRNGKPTLAALGITVVDESVFALAEMQPGLERLYFVLEQELLTPRYEVHGWELRPILLRREEGRGTRDEARTQRIAQILFAAATPPSLHTLRISTYEQKVQKVQEQWKKFVQDAATKIRKALETYRHAKGDYPQPDNALRELVAARLLTEKDIRDPLGNLLRLNPIDNFRYGFRLECAGLDGKFDTDDDIFALATGEGREREIRVIARNEMVFADGVVIATLGGVMKARAVTETAPAPRPASPAPEEVRVRQFFPETLFVNPQILTNERGEAELKLTLADSITTWRLTVLGNSETGKLGSTTLPIRVFQDFFVDIDLPVAFTQGDEVSVPIALYNYLAKTQTVRLRLEVGDGFEILGNHESLITLQPNEVTSIRFRLKAAKLGTHSITVYAYGDAMSDAVKRTVTVLPDGKEFWQTISDQLTGQGTRGTEQVKRTITVKIPQQAIDGASNMFVKVYAGAFSQVIDGLENLLRMPFGCFEQTSSITYPNVLILRYLKRTGKAQPETEMKARHFITIGYQRLLTFEVEGGGFSWFGNPPAHKVLTAYGLLEFADMSKVHDVDPNLIARTINWLISKQNPDGSWTPDQFGIQEGAVNRQNDILRATAYIAWAISEAGRGTGDEGRVKTALQKAVGYLSEHAHEADDAYALAVMLNALIGAKELFASAQSPVPSALIDEVSRRLANMAKESDEIAYWESKTPTPFHGRGQSGDLEATALATYALLRHGGYAPLVNKALTYLVRSKDEFGTWQTTQATIWALKAFLLAAEGAGAQVNGTLIVRVNGEKVAEWQITPENADIVRMADASKFVREGNNEVTLEFEGKGSLLYQVSARFFLPWELIPPAPEEPLQVCVNYDRTELQTNETVTCQVRVTNRRPMAAQMVIVDIGIPPGFEVLTDDLANLVERKVLQRFELTPRQVICYLDRIEGGSTVEWKFRMKAKMPVRAKTGRTTAYEYYAPQERSTVAPALLTAR